MKNLHTTSLARTAIILAVAIGSPTILGQDAARVTNEREAIQRAQREEKLRQVRSDMAAYAKAVVRRWEESAKATGRWDENYSADLQAALMKLQPENLLAASEASSYEAMMTVLATGRAQARSPRGPLALGNFADDQVYTPVAPCRIVDTRSAGGPIAGGTTRSFDVDGASFAGQGGFPGSCGVPFNVASAVELRITVQGPAAQGFLTAWAVGSSQPLASVLNYEANQVIGSSPIVPVVPGAGTDFNVYSLATTHVIIDVMGYFAAPIATALDCITVSTTNAAVAVNSWTSIDANCPAGRTATGGGYDAPTVGTQSYIGLWITTLPNGNGWRAWVDNQTSGTRSITAYCQCCRVPGR